MTKYQLAKLIDMAGGLRSRKRVQKTAYLLQAAGCPLALDFRLHYYGPYSADLAELVDRTTADGILLESSRETSVGTQYDYRFNDAFRESLDAFEKTPEGSQTKGGLEQHRELLRRLCETKPRVLELAATIAAFRERRRTWDEAVAETAAFKNETQDSPIITEARTLAESIVNPDDGEN
jgi:uncharacterized protein YwgA